MQLVLNIVFITVLLFFFSASPVRGSEELREQAVMEYTLPYPGLLPDHSLYFIKTFRDRVIGFLISDPIKKAEFSLLQADKRLGAGKKLFYKKKYKLAESTISKGENYLEESVANAQEAKQQGLPIVDFMEKLNAATTAHSMVLSELMETAPKEEKSKFVALQKRAETYKNQVTSLLQQK